MTVININQGESNNVSHSLPNNEMMINDNNGDEEHNAK